MVDDAIPMAILARFGTKNEFLLHTDKGMLYYISGVIYWANVIGARPLSSFSVSSRHRAY